MIQNLTKNIDIIENDDKVAETLKNCFRYIRVELRQKWKFFIINNDHKQIKDQIDKVIAKYQLHLKVLIIKGTLMQI